MIPERRGRRSLISPRSYEQLGTYSGCLLMISSPYESVFGCPEQ